VEEKGAPFVFVGTHLGLGVLIEPLLGEPIFAFKNRRRGERDPGWSGDRPVLATSPSDEGLILWAPMDSDRAYALRVGLPRASPSESEAVLATPCIPLIDAEGLLGGNENSLVVLGRTGRERTLSERPVGADRIDALDLRRDERFGGRGLLSARRALIATNQRVYLFDRERELYLLDSEALPEREVAEAGGDLYGRKATLVVVGANAAWVLRTE
jgi:hypothetical protein